jgi:hypothetical protein
MTPEQPTPKSDGEVIETINDPLYDELVSLRVRGLRSDITELPLPELTRIADAVCPEVDEFVERLRCAMKKAASRFKGKYGMALEALWGVNTTYGWTYTDRRKKAMPLLGGKQTKGAWEKGHRERTAQDFAVQLRELYEEIKAAEAPPELPEDDPAQGRETATQTAAPSEPLEVGPTARRPRIALRRLVSAKTFFASLVATLLLAICYLVASLTIWAGEATIPPPGTIVNATTGQVVERVVNRTTPRFVQVTTELSACDLTTTSTCGYVNEGERLTVHIGDIVEFSLSLFDPSNQPVPYLHMYTEDTTGETVRRVNGPIISRTYDGLRMNVHWPTRESSRGESASTEPVEIIYPKAAKGTDLTYILGSTVLFDQKGRVLAHLPDSIMEAGIALTDVGAPPSCSYCESEYERYVNFKVQVTEIGHS